MKIDLHVHARERSACSVSSEKELIKAAIKKGLDALAFTDHERLVPRWHLRELNEKFAPFRVFSGCEIHTKEEEDVLVFGVQDPKLEGMGWSYTDLHQFVRERSGFMVLAHPFRYREAIGADMYNYPPDAIEMRSTNLPPHTESFIRRVVEDISCGTIYSSDAHEAKKVGAYYIRLQGEPQDDPALLALLKARAYDCEQNPEITR